MIKCRISSLSIVELPGEEGQWSPGTVDDLLQHPPTWESDASTAREMGASGSGCTNSGMAERSSLALVKADVMAEVQTIVFPEPLVASVRGARILAAPRINFL